MPRGYNALADVIKATIDGTDLNTLWREFQATLTLKNEHRTALGDLLTASTDQATLDVAQSASDYQFEVATEFGVPVGSRVGPTTVRLGLPIESYDAATRYTWQFLSTAPTSQITAVNGSALEADNRLIFSKIMTALLTKTSAATRPTNEYGVQVLPLWDGEADATPPEFAGKTFAAGHTHYLTSGAVLLDGNDLRDLMAHVTHHGFGKNYGDQLVLLVNSQEGNQIRSFRSTTVVNGVTGPFDFIPSVDAPAYLTDQTIVGERAPAEFKGLRVIGSYGEAWVVESDYIPAGYVTAVAVSDNPTRKVLAFREAVQPGLKGLKLLGGDPDYPLMSSFYFRQFGVGVRQRGAAAVMQVTSSTTYTTPVVPS